MKTTVFIFLIILLFCNGFSQKAVNFKNLNPRFEIFKLPGGPLGNSVQTIVQDKTGFLWFGSQGGLHRYDGQNFVTYLHDPNNSNSLASNYCEYIFIDSKGILWITHYIEGGLTAFDPSTETFTRYFHQNDNAESLSHNYNSIITEDTNGYIWVGGKGGLDRFDRNSGKFKRFHHDPNDPKTITNDEVRGLYVDKQGTLWVGTGIFFNKKSSSGGLNRYDPKTGSFTRFVHDPNDPNSLIDNRVRSIFEDSKGHFWIGTNGDGLHTMNREKGNFKRLTYDPKNSGKLTYPMMRGTTPATQSPESHISSISEDKDGNIWVTGFPGGLAIFDPLSGGTSFFEAGKNEGDLSFNYLWHTFQSADGVNWITTAGIGKAVYKVKIADSRFPFFNWKRTGIDIGGVASSIVKDTDGNVWISFALASPQLIRYEPKTGKIYSVLSENKLDGILVRNINSLSLDREGGLWIGAGDLLSRRDPNSGKWKRYLSNINTTWTRKCIQDLNGNIWVPAGLDGLFRLDIKTGAYTHFQHDTSKPESLGGTVVQSVLEDAHGNIWVGGGDINNLATPLFLDRISPDGKIITHFIKTIEVGSARYISADAQGDIWFADQVGYLQQLNPITGMRKKYNSANIDLVGVNGNVGIPLVIGKEGRIWLNNGNNLIEFNPKTEKFYTYFESHGVHTVGSSNSPFHLSYDGEIFIAGDQGFLSFYSEKIAAVKENEKAILGITEFKLLGKRILPGKNSVLKKPVWQTEEIRLSHDQNIFGFSVACFDYHDAAASPIEFMLDGYDRLGWRKDLIQGETPTYVNVPAGNYTFLVRGADSQGNWNQDLVRLKITILPPWWKTWWAYILYAILFLGGIRIFSLWRERKLKKEKEQLQQKVEERTVELKKSLQDLKATQAQLIQSEKMASLGELTAGIAHEIQNPLNFVNNFSDLNNELVTEINDELANCNEQLAIGKEQLKESLGQTIGNKQQAMDNVQQSMVNVQELIGTIKENSKKINHHGKRAESIVKGMLEHSRKSTGTKEPTDINKLCDEFTRLSYHGLRAKDPKFNCDYKLDLDPNMPLVNVASQDIGRVILNVVNNAFQACFQQLESKESESQEIYKPLVSISTHYVASSHPEASGCEICIADNGPGIPDAIKDKIFQPFFTTKPTGQGTGLGLSLSYDIVKAHGGELKVETKESHPGDPRLNDAVGQAIRRGEGCQFIIQLPINQN